MKKYSFGKLVLRFFLVVFISFELFINPPSISAAIPAPSGGYWYRGNTHLHVEGYDRAMIVNWYKNGGYDFLAVTDHEDTVNQQTYCTPELSTATFLMICAVELSWGNHVTAFGINQYISSGTRILQNNVNTTLSAGGVPSLNHPMDSDGSAMSASTFLSVVGLNHFEVVNGQRPEQTAGSEILWDNILSASNGRLAYGVGADDNHYTQSQALKGWIVVKAPSLNKADILANVRNGNFYASTGIVLNDYVVDLAAKTITVDSQNGNTITFIGNNGTVLKTVSGASGSYQVTGSEKYVRAKITNTAGKMAWTQPIYVTSFAGITPPPTSPVVPTATRTPTPPHTPTPTLPQGATPTHIPTPTPPVSTGTLHMTANEDGAYTNAAAIGFNVHDTGMSTSVINALPAGSQAMVWVGIGSSNCSATLTSTFTSFVLANATNPKLYGFYLNDEPVNNTCVTAVTAYTKYIHDNAPGKKSFILLTDWPGTYAAYKPSATGVDLIGLDPYPVKDYIVSSADGNYSVADIPHEVNDALANGIPLSAIVPVFQTFGSPASGGYQGWGSPTADQLNNRILSQWATLVPNPQLDYAYSWGLQSGGLGEALVNRTDWRDIMAAHNNGQPISTQTPTPVILLGDITGPSGVPDRVIDVYDYNKIKTDFGKTGTAGFIVSDIDKNGKVDIFDYNYIVMNYGRTY